MGEYADSLSKSKAAKAAETARETRNAKRDADAKAAAKAAALAATRKEDKADVQRAKVAAGKVVVAPAPKPVQLPHTPTVTNTPTPTPFVPTPTPTIETIDKSTGIVNGVNIQEEYFKAIREIVMSLVKNAKGLLTRYNFSGVDRIPEYYLDADRDAQSTAIITQPNRPQYPYGPGQADYQDKFSLDINEINNKISDLVSDIDKSQYFGSLKGDVFVPKELKISNGTPYYDMRLVFNSLLANRGDFTIKCYEIS